MTDTNTEGPQEGDAPWLEKDDEFEGVGAHRDNPRYDHIPEDVPEDVPEKPA